MRVATRQQSILAASASLFSLQGIEKTNLRQIAQKAGMVSGTLHYYFPSKAKLVETLVVECVENLDAKFRQILEGDEHPRQKLQELMNVSYRTFDENWEVCSTVLLHGEERKRLWRNLPADILTLTKALIVLIQAGQRQNLVASGDALPMALLCHGMHTRFPQARAYGEIEPPLSQYVETVVEGCWRVLKV